MPKPANILPAPIGPRLLALSTATGTLTPTQVHMIGAALVELDRLSARRSALEAACRILNGNQGLSRWGLALALESHLRRFRGKARKRIEAGWKNPSDWELILHVLSGPTPAPGDDEPEPTCARRLWDEIKEIWD